MKAAPAYLSIISLLLSSMAFSQTNTVKEHTQKQTEKTIVYSDHITTITPLHQKTIHDTNITDATIKIDTSKIIKSNVTKIVSETLDIRIPRTTLDFF